MSNWKKKRKSVPRPAPNYAERLKVQGSNRNLDDLKAISRRPQAQDKDESHPSGETKPVVPDLSLGKVFVDKPPLKDGAAMESPSTETSHHSAPETFWDDDLTTLQTAPMTDTDLTTDQSSSNDEDVL